MGACEAGTRCKLAPQAIATDNMAVRTHNFTPRRSVRSQSEAAMPQCNSSLLAVRLGSPGDKQGLTEAGGLSIAPMVNGTSVVNGSGAPLLSPQAPPSRQGDDKKASGGLAARRRKVLGNLRTDGGSDMQPGEKLPGKEDILRNKINRIENFADIYTLGCEVMPSTNTGMDVLHARRKSDGANVVVKRREKRKSFARGEELEWRRNTEMVLNLPKNDNIAQVYEVAEDASYYYIVMEKCDGMDLFEVIDHDGPCSMGEARAILRKLLQGVFELHSRGCIHKDLKLENIMVDKSGASSPSASPPRSPRLPAAPKPAARPAQPKFIAKLDAKNASNRDDSPEPIVKLIDFDTVVEYNPTCPKTARSVVGTDQYIAQEAYAGQYSTASDIFACGVIAFKLISGKFPFKNRMFDDQPGENYVGSPKMEQIRQRLVKFEIDWTIAPWQTEPQAKALAQWMLQSNENERPTAAEALNHVFLATTGTTPGLPQGPWGSRKRDKTATRKKTESLEAIAGA